MARGLEKQGCPHQASAKSPGGAPVDIRVWQLSAIDLTNFTTLTDLELRRAASLDTALARERFLAARLAMRATIAEEVGVEPTEVKAGFQCSRCGLLGDADHGKPRYTVDGVALQIGVSYSRCGDWGVGLISRAVRDLGIDIDDASKNAFSSVEVEEIFATQRERKWLATRRRQRRQRSRAQLWARKEAALKATGHGLRIDPSAFDVGRPGRTARVHPPTGDDGSAHIQIQDHAMAGLRLPSEYVVSTALLIRST